MDEAREVPVIHIQQGSFKAIFMVDILNNEISIR